MVVDDKSLILERLWQQPAANAELIVALDPEAVVYASDPAGSAGFVALQQYPQGKFASVDAPTAEQAESLLLEAQVHECWRVMAFDPDIAEIIEKDLGFNVVRQSLCHSVDKDGFSPCEMPDNVKQVTPESASYVLEFAATEADDHPSWESQTSDDWSTIAYYVEDEGSIVGYADSIAQPGVLGEIGYVYVKPEMRGKGYGKMVVSAVTAHMLDRGQIPLYIVHATNHASIATCQSVGYQVRRRSWLMESGGRISA